MRRREFLAASALALLREIPVFVGGCNYSAEQFQPSGGKQSDLGKFDAAGVRGILTAVGSGSYFAIGPGEYELAGPDEWILQQQLKNLNAALATIRACPRARLISTADEMRRWPTADPLGVVLHISGNAHTFRVDTVDTFARMGVRAWHPALPYHNRWCSAKESKPGPVLTEFGREAIARMNQVGIAVDTAHATDESARAFIRASSRPVIDTHTSSSTWIPESRGHDDGTLRMIADSGGVIGVQFAEQFLTREVWKKKYARESGKPSEIWEYNRRLLADTKDPEERMKRRKKSEPMTGAVPMAHVTDLANAIDYLIKVAGEEHVGLGGDVNGIDWHQWPADMRNIGELPHLSAELLRRGYTERRLRLLYAENWRRVFADTMP